MLKIIILKNTPDFTKLSDATLGSIKSDLVEVFIQITVVIDLALFLAMWL